MTFSTKAIFAIAAVLAALGGATQAGEGTVMLGSSGFADRCDSSGGALFEVDDGYACDLGTATVACAFEGAYAECEWTGAQNQMRVVRLIGMVTAESIASQNLQPVDPGYQEHIMP